MQIKTDHFGVILPAGSKLKPIRTKVLIRDRRAHRKIALYQALENENWNQVLSANHPDQAVEKLEAVIHRHLNNCMPQRTVSMSTRDPHWMSPLVKSMLKTKAKVSISNTERLQHLNRRISQLISENRTHLLANPIGSQKWWKEVDSRSQRRTAAGSVALEARD